MADVERGIVGIAVIDDDHWRRERMAEELRTDRRFAVLQVFDQDTAVGVPADTWSGVEVAVVDVFDEFAPGEVGTDLYSGIKAIGTIERLRGRGVVTLAITPHRSHPLVELRLCDAGADFVYRRWEVNDLESLADAILRPDPERRSRPPSSTVLDEFGARAARPNDAVRVYETSPLSGKLRTEQGHKTLRMPRRSVDRLRMRVSLTGFVGSDPVRVVPRWPETRDYLLRLIGRLDVPPSDHDARPNPPRG